MAETAFEYGRNHLQQVRGGPQVRVTAKTPACNTDAIGMGLPRMLDARSALDDFYRGAIADGDVDNAVSLGIEMRF